LEDLMGQMSTLASIYHKPPEAFVIKQIPVGQGDEDDEPIDGPEDYDLDYGGNDSGGAPPPPKPSGGGDLLDLLDDTPPAPAPASTNNLFDAPTSAPSNIPKTVLLTAEAGQGLVIAGVMTRRDGQLILDMDISNQGPTPVQALAIKFNKNTFGITPQNPQLMLPTVIANGTSTSAVLALTCTPQMLNPENPNLVLQVAVKNMATNAVLYFAAPVDMSILFKPTQAMEVQALVNAWKGIDDSLEVSVVINDLPTVNVEAIKSKLVSRNIVFVAQRDVPGQEGQIVLYFNCQTVTNAAFLVELKFKAGFNMAKLTVKSTNKALSELCKVTVGKLMIAQ